MVTMPKERRPERDVFESALDTMTTPTLINTPRDLVEKTIIIIIGKKK